jgi:hypothetical protein
MAGTCTTHTGEPRNVYKNMVNLKVGDNFCDLDLDGRIILK